MEKSPKIANEITVRISLTFQEAPDIHTLLAMTPARERGKLVRLALERYIKETDHPAGDVEQQINAISAWLRSRGGDGIARASVAQPQVATFAQHVATNEIVQPSAQETQESILAAADASPSISRWLQA